LRFAEPDLADVVYIEQLTSALYLDKPVEVDSYLEVMDRLCLQARPAAHTPGILRQILADILPSALRILSGRAVQWRPAVACAA
jgi:hypothetical protein